MTLHGHCVIKLLFLKRPNYFLSQLRVPTNKRFIKYSDVFSLVFKCPCVRSRSKPYLAGSSSGDIWASGPWWSRPSRWCWLWRPALVWGRRGLWSMWPAAVATSSRTSSPSTAKTRPRSERWDTDRIKSLGPDKAHQPSREIQNCVVFDNYKVLNGCGVCSEYLRCLGRNSIFNTNLSLFPCSLCSKP